MADRGAARLFGNLFDELAKLKASGECHGATIDLVARMMWEQSIDYDFDPCQLECDAESLIALWLARRLDNPGNIAGEDFEWGPCDKEVDGA